MGSETRQFEYLLNAMEHASQADSPSQHGFREKRLAVLDYVDRLERRDHAADASEARQARLDEWAKAALIAIGVTANDQERSAPPAAFASWAWDFAEAMEAERDRRMKDG